MSLRTNKRKNENKNEQEATDSSKKIKITPKPLSIEVIETIIHTTLEKWIGKENVEGLDMKSLSVQALPLLNNLIKKWVNKYSQTILKSYEIYLHRNDEEKEIDEETSICPNQDWIEDKLCHIMANTWFYERFPFLCAIVKKLRPKYEWLDADEQELNSKFHWSLLCFALDLKL